MELKSHAPMDDAARAADRGSCCAKQHIPIKRDYVDSGRLILAFNDVASQLKARDAVDADAVGHRSLGAVVRLARAGLDARAGPEGDAAGTGPARRAVPALPGGREQRGEPAARQL